MKPEERQNKILAILRAMQREMRVEELSAMLEVSPLTIRRDLESLVEHKTIIRTHGGCIFVGRAALETEYHQKVAKNYALKQAIGTAAAELVKPNQVLLINDGSTTFHLAAQLGTKGPLTIYTNSIAMISELNRFQEIRLFVIGGEYNPESYSLRGVFAEQMLEGLHFDQVFLGADGIDADALCTVATPEEARLTRCMLSRAAKKVLIADHTKAGRKGHAAYGRLGDFDLWITTPGVPNYLLRSYQSKTVIQEAVSSG